MKTLAIAALALGLAATGSAHAATNLITNGSFENGLDGWTTVGSDSDNRPPVAIFYNNAVPYPYGAYGESVAPNNAVTSSPDAAGARAAYLVSDFANHEGLTQTFTVTTAGTYNIGFSAYAPANGYANRTDAAFSGSIAGVTLADYMVSSHPETLWQTFSGSAFLTPGTYQANFLFDTNGFPAKDVVIDQAFVVGVVPEPVSWAMMIVGFGMTGALLRRRRDAAASTFA
jgi:hypothetical protein